jgi:hypothetical protein
VSAAYAAFSGKTTAKSKLSPRRCAEIGCKGTKIFHIPFINLQIIIIDERFSWSGGMAFGSVQNEKKVFFMKEM